MVCEESCVKFYSRITSSVSHKQENEIFNLTTQEMMNAFIK